MYATTQNYDVFVTHLVTNLKRVSINVNFSFRPGRNHSEGTVYLIITGSGERERINTFVKTTVDLWDHKKQRIKPISQVEQDYNLILDTFRNRVHKIEIAYRFQERGLTPKLLRQELELDLPRLNFVKFMETMLEERKKNYTKGTIKKHNTVISKLYEYNPNLMFNEITLQFVEDYKNFLSKKGNNKNTIHGNFQTIKVYMNLAKKYRIQLPIESNDIKIGSTQSPRMGLNEEELERLIAFYKSTMCIDTEKLALANFLFSCFTGLRISDIERLERKQLQEDEIFFVATKTKKNQMIRLNDPAKRIAETCEDFLVKRNSWQHVNRMLKIIFKRVGIKKRGFMHLGRHTFAINFLKAGGKVENLQKILAHTNIQETLTYAKILNEEANKEMMLLNKFKI